MARQESNLQAVMSEGRKEGRQAGTKEMEVGRCMVCLFLSTCMCANAKKYSFFFLMILIDTNLLEAPIEILCNICC